MHAARGGGGVGKMRANACKGGGGVTALSAHASWPLKTPEKAVENGPFQVPHG